jgi:elongator complex protein 1
LFNPQFDTLAEEPIDDGDCTNPEEYIGKAAISWRGDSSLFQINYQIGDGFKSLTRDPSQNLKVFKGPARSDNNTVFSVSEKPVKELGRPICFMPNGSFVAGYIRQQEKRVVAFWEKNGLRHDEFELPDSNMDVIYLEFSPDSSLLAVVCLKDDFSSMSVLICARSNWQWQIKYRIDDISFEKTLGVRALKWMGSRKQQLFIVDGRGKVQFVEFHFRY